MVMNDFERRRKANQPWYSPDFYTHVGGYKMGLEIGWSGRKDTHVGAFVFIVPGEFDSHLKWPFEGEITVELVNQKEGGVNCERKVVVHTDPEVDFLQLTESQLISQADLYKPEEGKEYLLNDTLIFRVTKIEVTSI